MGLWMNPFLMAENMDTHTLAIAILLFLLLSQNNRFFADCVTSSLYNNINDGEYTHSMCIVQRVHKTYKKAHIFNLPWLNKIIVIHVIANIALLMCDPPVRSVELLKIYQFPNCLHNFKWHMYDIMPLIRTTWIRKKKFERTYSSTWNYSIHYFILRLEFRIDTYYASY